MLILTEFFERSDEFGTDSGSESGSASVSRQRRKKKSTNHRSQKKTKHAAELFDDSSSQNSESEPERTTIGKPSRMRRENALKFRQEDEYNGKCLCPWLTISLTAMADYCD